MKPEVIQEIIKRLRDEPTRIITSTIGSGCHARKMDEGSYKVVIPGDTFKTALTQLDYLLFDLGIDVGLDTKEIRDFEV